MNAVKMWGVSRPSYHHGALAEALVDVAVGQVRTQGSERVTLRGVAQAVGVSPSAAYNHFADKDDLLRAVGACGLAALDERMTRVLAAHPAYTADAARARFSGLGRAYLAFAIEETHLFQLTFGPICAVKEMPPEETGPFRKLIDALDDLDRRGLIKPGTRDGLDLIVWAGTHGMATLLVEGAVSPDAVDAFIDSMSRLVMVDSTS